MNGIRGSLQQAMDGYDEYGNPAINGGTVRAQKVNPGAPRTISFDAPGGPAPLMPQQITQLQPLGGEMVRPYSMGDGMQQIGDAMRRKNWQDEIERRTQQRILGGLFGLGGMTPSAPALPAGAGDLSGVMGNIG